MAGELHRTSALIHAARIDALFMEPRRAGRIALNGAGYPSDKADIYVEIGVLLVLIPRVSFDNDYVCTLHA
jgi:hypothetical protein